MSTLFVVLKLGTYILELSFRGQIEGDTQEKTFNFIGRSFLVRTCKNKCKFKENFLLFPASLESESVFGNLFLGIHRLLSLGNLNGSYEVGGQQSPTFSFEFVPIPTP
jgi:hypothetical protein